MPISSYWSDRVANNFRFSNSTNFKINNSTTNHYKVHFFSDSFSDKLQGKSNNQNYLRLSEGVRIKKVFLSGESSINNFWIINRVIERFNI